MTIKKFVDYKSLTFDDVLLIPAESEVIPTETDISSYLTKDIKLNVPILSAAMDKVTETKMAIKMAQLGGLGIIHKNMSPQEQSKQVFKVKNFEGGMINNPVTLNIDQSLQDYFEKRIDYTFSGFPVISKESRKLLGFISEKDIKFVTDTTSKISDLMTKREHLVTVSKATSIEKVRDKMSTNKIEQVLVIDENDNLMGLVSARGIVESNLYPNATRDNQSRLRVGAAVGINDYDKERVDLLVEAGVDVIVVDTAHGHSKNVKKMIEYIKSNYSNINIIGGNIATYDAAKFLIDAGVDCVKVGIGSGSICTTRIISGVGMPQLTALLNVQKACEGTDVTFIADGGLKQSGDIAKAMATGAFCVMLGSLLSGTDEAPGDIITINGQSYKEYRGMGSMSAMLKGSADRYFQDSSMKNKNKLVPEGVEARVTYKGSVSNIIFQLTGGLKAAMGYTGCPTIPIFHKKSQFTQITNAGLQESHIHSVQMIGDCPNYTRK